MSQRTTAVADLGSNSFRLVLFTAGDEWWRRTDEIYEAVRIGSGLDDRGELSAERIERALAVTEVFAAFCEAQGLDGEDVVAVATSAIRDATNRDAFLRRAPLPVRVLTTGEEARFGYLAAVNSTRLDDGAVLDLGGGSVQLVRVEGRRATRLGSWPLGAVRMTERFLPDDGPAKAKHLKALRAHVREVLAEAPWLSESPALVGIGGTVRNLASATAAAAGLPSAVAVQGASVTREALGALVERLAALSPAERRAVAGVKPARADIILAGAAVVEAVLDAGGLDALEATEAGLREGVFFARHLAPSDPPLFEDVRAQSVRNLAAQYGQRGAHVEQVERLALGLFDDLAVAGLHPGDPAERELLGAAAQLHDVGMAVDYDDHHKHGRYLILNAGLPGWSPREVVLIAQAVRYHRKGDPAFPADLAKVVGEGDDAVLARLATLLRLAEGLERSRDQAVRATRVRAKDGCVRVALDVATDPRVARWAAEREGPLFERAFGRALELRAG